MNKYLTKLKNPIAALFVAVLLANCAGVDDYQAYEYEAYCLPYYQLSGNSSAYQKVFIRDYPNKRDFTYTSNIGDTIISKGEVTHTKQTRINLKSEDVIYLDSPQVPTGTLPLFDDNELARLYTKSFSGGCGAQSSIDSFATSNFDLLDKTKNLYLDGTLQWQSFSKFETKGNIEAIANSHAKGILYTFLKKPSSRSFRSSSSNEPWVKKTYSIPTSVFVPTDADGYFFLVRSKLSSISDRGYIQLKNMLPVKGSIEIIKEDNIYTPNQNSDSLFNQYLIYNGRSGDSVKFLYREFMGDMNRASFQQEVSYDLKIGEVIGFKGARFKIIEANNVQLKYQVIEAF
jgi:hypothetical protein